MHGVHPSKRRRCSHAKASYSLSDPATRDSDRESEEKEIEEYNYGEDDRVDQNDCDSNDTYSYTRRYNNSVIGTKLVTEINISINKVAKI